MTRAALTFAVVALFVQLPNPVAARVAPPLPRQASSSAASKQGPDFEVFRTRIQPILTTARKGNARCIACHSRGGGNAFLEPLSPGTSAYTLDQSVRNFERIQRLVVPGEPLKSALLANPLAEEAGGTHWHGGGKHWTSQNDPEWQALATWVRTPASSSPPALAASASGASSGNPAASGASGTAALDYEAFKTRVQPILTSPRKGNARCTACHSRGGGNAFLEPLAPGAAAYTEEQSRRNFERIRRLVVPGEPLKSALLALPLAEEAGGSHWHGGGKHWTSQNDSEWQVMAAWVRGR